MSFGPVGNFRRESKNMPRILKAEGNKITEITCRYIIDALLLDKDAFYGRLDLVGFLRRRGP